jgi:hypothetical protein
MTLLKHSTVFGLQDKDNAVLRFHFTFKSCHSGDSEISTGLVSAILGATAVA